jgi:hypothetical protein
LNCGCRSCASSTQAFSGRCSWWWRSSPRARAGSPWAVSYHAIGHLPIRVGVGGSSLDHPLAHWINDGVMAVFFFLVGLGIEREAMTGELASLRRIITGMSRPTGASYAPSRPPPRQRRPQVVTARDVDRQADTGGELPLRRRLTRVGAAPDRYDRRSALAAIPCIEETASSSTTQLGR